ncbi:MAG: serine/threonine-protein kinase PknG [Actinobacteria bacterium]|nr:serine/threonine-protein kinase PknG [Actinomycetota bacterium]HRW01081.1 tetratricopeptide repeat protein [Tetrasphaera sp.]
MSELTACRQPGCTGTVADGYCDVCGMPGEPDQIAAAAAPPAPAAARPAPAAAAPAPPPPVAQPSGVPPSPWRRGQAGAPRGAGPSCRQPGCTGTIVDGYCDVCGTPATPTSTMTTQPVGSGESPVEASNSQVSARLDATALGSERARSGGTISTRRVSGHSQRMRTARIGAGVTSVPPVPEIDAAKAVIKNPVVPEDKRFCPKCGEPVGRGRDGQEGRTTGFCANCRTPFDFSPKLKPGDLVAGQYEVAGCLAHGGLGWIYLARDRNVSNRWVVLKGLLNSGDPDALAAALAEQRFLAQVSHPNIVEIYNFVSHEGAGYIVMEYIGGTSLKSLLKQRMRAAGKYDPLPVDQALAYIIEILPAFQYLHDLGLVYCDFKPDNIIQIGDEVRLIDLGGVRRLDDQDSAIFGTVGYQAPEVAEHGVSVASDIYTIGRTLVVLTMEFRGYQTKYVKSLPPVEEVAVFEQYDSFYRLLLKACAPSPDDRFVSADEMRVQMLGVLREVVAQDKNAGAATTSAPSVLFAPPAAGDSHLTYADLPALHPDSSDQQIGWLATIAAQEPAQRLRALASAPGATPEVFLAQARAALELGQWEVLDGVVQRMLAEDPWEWRAVWMQGLAALARKSPTEAQSAFNAVYGQVPGELAPKFGLAIACALSGNDEIAERLYTICARTDAAYVPQAAFALARIRGSRGDTDGVQQALTLVPPNSSAYPLARQHWAEHLAAQPRDTADLTLALQTADDAGFSRRRRAELGVDIYGKALARVEESGPKPGERIGDFPVTADGMRSGLERALRLLADVTDNPLERMRLIDKANDIRPWSLV